MTTKRVQFNNIVQNQLPGYVKSDYPLVAEFLKSYYQGQEYEGGPIDLVQNIDQYTKVSEQVGITEHVGLGASIGIVNDTIEVDMKENLGQYLKKLSKTYSALRCSFQSFE